MNRSSVGKWARRAVWGGLLAVAGIVVLTVSALLQRRTRAD